MLVPSSRAAVVTARSVASRMSKHRFGVIRYRSLSRSQYCRICLLVDAAPLWRGSPTDRAGPLGSATHDADGSTASTCSRPYEVLLLYWLDATLRFVGMARLPLHSQSGPTNDFPIPRLGVPDRASSPGSGGSAHNPVAPAESIPPLSCPRGRHQVSCDPQVARFGAEPVRWVISGR